MPEKQKGLVTEKNDMLMQGLNINRILQYMGDSELEFHQESLPRKSEKKDLLDFFIEYVCLNDRINLKEFLEQLERTILLKILAKFNGNQKATAKFLGIKYTTLNEKVKKYRIHFRKQPVEKFM